MTELDGRIGVGELALLPLGNRLVASASGRVLSARVENLSAPSNPQRLRDRLIALLLKRAWASRSTSSNIVEPTLRFIEALAASKVREHQEHLDFLESLDPRIAAVLDHIEAQYGGDLTVAKLAAIANLSPSHFSRAFKAAMGDPVWSYLQRRRCERAREMLLTTDLPNVEIAYRCGFASQAHFTTTFRKAFGVTPGSLRRDNDLQIKTHIKTSHTAFSAATANRQGMGGSNSHQKREY